MSEAPTSEEDILRSKLRTQGRIITNLCEKSARLERRIHTLTHAANGHPTPRIVTQIKKIRAAAGTNSITKILAFIELGLAAHTEDSAIDDSQTISDGFGGEWILCKRDNCGLEVVRPGKVQCWCDTESGPER